MIFVIGSNRFQSSPAGLGQQARRCWGGRPKGRTTACQTPMHSPGLTDLSKFLAERESLRRLDTFYRGASHPFTGRPIGCWGTERTPRTPFGTLFSLPMRANA
jgi:hypothetical protein